MSDITMLDIKIIFVKRKIYKKVNSYGYTSKIIKGAMISNVPALLFVSIGNPHFTGKSPMLCW